MKLFGREAIEELRSFREFGTKTVVSSLESSGGEVPVFVNEFWTAKQRAAHRLHEISYRACFKPQLPRFFIERLTSPGDVVFDPFMGRGTTLLEAAILGRVPAGNDANPLCRHLIAPRLAPPTLSEVSERLAQIDWDRDTGLPEDLLAFYHKKTLRELCSLRAHLLGSSDRVDGWIRMIALNRLTGHSLGFFSVYTLPPNQAVSVASQRKINARRNQAPEYRDVSRLILRRSRSLLSDEVTGWNHPHALLTTGPCRDLSGVPGGAVSLVVTSPPFLNVVDYATDNWLRCWFAGVEPVTLTTPSRLEEWAEEMTASLKELARILKPGGHVAFEVGEVKKGKIRLEETVLHAGAAAGLKPLLVLVNAQEFTKTAHCWGVANNAAGTNTNRIVLFQKPG